MASALNLLVLGGTAWLGREFSRKALERGHTVTCLARGESGSVADGATLVRADRSARDAYAAVADRDWDGVLDVSWQSAMVRSAVSALRGRTRQWIYVSSCSVYASHAEIGADEAADVLAPTDVDAAGMELYGEAKVACEEACRAAGEGGLLIARAGLIGGPGDLSDRAGYWVARSARNPTGPMLMPRRGELLTQVVDVRDLAAWLLHSAETGVSGTYNAVGPAVRLTELIDLSRTIGGHTGPVVEADDAWLLEQGVVEAMGPGSLALWIADPDWLGFAARSGAAAQAAGLSHRPLSELLADSLVSERELGLDRERKTGLSPARETELLARLASS
jgi:2'-hydroxyisoflavone reductase